ncbi:MAG: 16S rRNA (uracil(1498)-N(3))-methyltransferase, partial [Rubrivivax sp.]
MTLPPGATRHAQVRRVQPGDTVVLFDGLGSDWPATVLQVTRSAVAVRTAEAMAVDCELPLHVTLALGMPANERMDALVEKATELGVARIQPLLTERSVLRLSGERADRKREHWQAVAEAACEQCGRARVPVVEPVRLLLDWLHSRAAATSSADERRLLLNPAAAAARSLTDAMLNPKTGSPFEVVTLSGPEGGLSAEECRAARLHGFVDVGLGPRVLRADTAPLAVLAWLGL